MGKSLNSYASRVAHLVGQPDNQSLKERVKDMIKDYFAKYISQSVDRNGIQPYYKLTLLVDMIPIPTSKVVNLDKTEYFTEYRSSTKIPKPMNIKNDAPFTRVCVPNSSKLFVYKPNTQHRISRSSFPTGSCRSYSYINDTIIVKATVPASTLVKRIVFDKEYSEEETPKLEIEAIWENPEEVIGYYDIDDNQDLDLPFPNEMLNFVIADLLKVEFNIVPKDIEVASK